MSPGMRPFDDIKPLYCVHKEQKTDTQPIMTMRRGDAIQDDWCADIDADFQKRKK